MIAEARPTAVNLRWAIDRMLTRLRNTQAADRVRVAYEEAAAICDEDVAQCRAIGEQGVPLIEAVAEQKPGREPVNVLTHCNAGWLATVDWGTALAPIYMAHDKGIDLCMCGWTRLARAIRARRSRPGSWGGTAWRTPLSRTMPAVI